MNTWFSAAAIDRCADCTWSTYMSSDSRAAVYVLKEAQERLSDETYRGTDELFSLELFGFDHSRLRVFLELIELGVQCGYIELNDWEHVALLRDVVGRWKALVDRNPVIGVSSLSGALAGRMIGGEHRTEKQSMRVLCAFESYLMLTRRVLRDRSVQGVIEHLRHSWRPGLDDGLFLSPSDFVDSFVENNGENVVGMPRLLSALEWLVSICERLAPQDGLQKAVLEHARWADVASNALKRADEWAVSMSEWMSPRDFVGESRWEEFRARVLVRLAVTREGFGLASSGAKNMESEGLHPLFSWEYWISEGSAEELARKFAAAGRYEKARRTLARHMASLAARAENAVDENSRVAAIEDLVAHAEVLDEFGGTQLAAKYVAPFVTTIVQRADLHYSTRALAILAKARGHGFEIMSEDISSGPPVQDNPSIGQMPPPVPPGLIAREESEGV